MSDTRPHVLVVDDEVDFCELMTLRLEHHGFRVTCRHTLQGGFDVLDRERVDALVLDVRLEDEDGLTLFAHVKDRGLGPPTVILTAEGAAATGTTTDLGRGDALMPKPFDTQQLVAWLMRAVQRTAPVTAPAGGGTG